MLGRGRVLLDKTVDLPALVNVVLVVGPARRADVRGGAAQRDLVDRSERERGAAEVVDLVVGRQVEVVARRGIGARVLDCLGRRAGRRVVGVGRGGAARVDRLGHQAGLVEMLLGGVVGIVAVFGYGDDWERRRRRLDLKGGGR